MNSDDQVGDDRHVPPVGTDPADPSRANENVGRGEGSASVVMGESAAPSGQVTARGASDVDGGSAGQGSASGDPVGAAGRSFEVSRGVVEPTSRGSTDSAGVSSARDRNRPERQPGPDRAPSVESPTEIEPPTEIGPPTEIEHEPTAATSVFGARIDLARRYVQALAGDAVVRGLIGPREAGRLWSRHVMNSAVAGTLLNAGSRVLDIGSGAGLPGIPLAIARPDCNFVLIEPLERRTVFLQQVVADLNLTNCRVVRGRADQVVPECGEADVATSRAVAPLERLARWSSPLLRIGGELLALKGSSAAEEIERDRDAVAATGLVDLRVVAVGAGIVDPETVVIRGRRISVAASSRSARAKGEKRRTDRRP